MSTDRKIRGVRSVESRAIVRRVRQPQGAAAARGLEVTVTLDDKAFEGSGAFLLGAVLDRFFAEYVAINHFTQTVVRTPERGEIMRWPPRLGLRGLSVTFRDEIAAEPWRFDLFAVLRRLEAENQDKPRIGASKTLSDEFVACRRTPISASPHRTSRAPRPTPRASCGSRRDFWACSARKAPCP